MSTDFDAVHISIGDLLRQNQLISPEIDSGNLASDTTVLNLLKNKIGEVTNKVCLDGFPRRKSQAESLELILEPGTLEAVILLEIPESTLLERITGDILSV